MLFLFCAPQQLKQEGFSGHTTSMIGLEKLTAWLRDHLLYPLSLLDSETVGGSKATKQACQETVKDREAWHAAVHGVTRVGHD